MMYMKNKSPTLDEDYEEAVFDKTVSIDGISVNVYADRGVFPKSAGLSVKKVLKKADKEKVEVAIDEKLKYFADIGLYYLILI